MARFLVVDNDAATSDAITRLLDGDGHDVESFSTGAEALEATSTSPYDAVITDLETPSADGYAVLDALREQNPNACLVVATGKANEKHKELAKAGVCFVADKPFDYDTVTKELADCHSRGGPAAHGRCHKRSSSERLIPLRRR